jgi:hypothetical protein
MKNEKDFTETAIVALQLSEIYLLQVLLALSHPSELVWLLGAARFPACNHSSTEASCTFIHICCPSQHIKRAASERDLPGFALHLMKTWHAKSILYLGLY